MVGGPAIVDGERQRRTLVEVISDAAADSWEVEVGAMLMVVMINDKVWKTNYETENKTQ